MFKFGFSKDSTEESSEIKDVINKKKGYKAMEIHLNPNLNTSIVFDDDAQEFLTHIEVDDKTKIRHVTEEIVAKLLKKQKDLKSSVRQAEIHNSDLINGIYEGGLKIWQCTFDLLCYLKNNEIHFDQKKVLDLGCGMGIVGIYAMELGAQVCFQDYNSEVIKFVTIPNVVLNTNHPEKCRFFSGDWESFLEITEKDDMKFDVILTSETIYNCENFDKLHHVFVERLNDGGVIYLAAKTYYFGVGGGTRQFEDEMRHRGRFKFETCWTCDTGVKREILKITFA